MFELVKDVARRGEEQKIALEREQNYMEEREEEMRTASWDPTPT